MGKKREETEGQKEEREKREGRERKKLLFRRKTDRQGEGGWGQGIMEICLPLQEIGSGQDLSIKGTGYPGHRAGRQIITLTPWNSPQFKNSYF